MIMLGQSGPGEPNRVAATQALAAYPGPLNKRIAAIVKDALGNAA